jgi:hypothetical protein
MKSTIPVIAFVLAGMVTLPQCAPAQPVPADAPIMRHSVPRTDKTRLRPRHVVPKPRQAYEPEVPVKVREWISPALASPGFVLDAQPPAQPHSGVVVDRPVRF